MYHKVCPFFYPTGIVKRDKMDGWDIASNFVTLYLLLHQK